MTLTPFELSNPRVLDLPVERMNSILFRSGEREHRIDLRRATNDLGAEEVTPVASMASRSTRTPSPCSPRRSPTWRWTLPRRPPGTRRQAIRC